jgi:hypothetical protein
MQGQQGQLIVVVEGVEVVEETIKEELGARE